MCLFVFFIECCWYHFDYRSTERSVLKLSETIYLSARNEFKWHRNGFKENWCCSSNVFKEINYKFRHYSTLNATKCITFWWIVECRSEIAKYHSKYVIWVIWLMHEELCTILSQVEVIHELFLHYPMILRVFSSNS